MLTESLNSRDTEHLRSYTRADSVGHLSAAKREVSFPQEGRGNRRRNLGESVETATKTFLPHFTPTQQGKRKQKCFLTSKLCPPICERDFLSKAVYQLQKALCAPPSEPRACHAPVGSSRSFWKRAKERWPGRRQWDTGALTRPGSLVCRGGGVWLSS